MTEEGRAGPTMIATGPPTNGWTGADRAIDRRKATMVAISPMTSANQRMPLRPALSIESTIGPVADIRGS